MRKAKKVIAVLLAVLMFMGSFTVMAFASDRDLDPSADAGSAIKAKLYSVLDKIIFFLVDVINKVMPGLDWTSEWPTLANYKSDDFYAGEATFDYDIADGAKWSMGYACGDLLDGIDPLSGDYFLGGSLEAFSGRAPEAVIDGQEVVVYALSDGNGIFVQAVVDCFAIARGDVLAIRNALADFIAEKNIISLNVSALHQHSCIDTLGLSTPLVPALLANPLASVLKIDSMKVNGKNETFMNNLYTKTAECVKAAVNGMTEGDLYYGDFDADTGDSDFIYDKRAPQVYDKYFHALKFVPADGGREIWVANAGIHDVSFGASADVLSADWPYHLRKAFAKAGKDLVWVQGSELAITTEYDTLNTYYAGYDEDALPRGNGRVLAIANVMADKLMAIDNFTALDPVLNVAFKEFTINPENGVLALAVREGLVASVVAKNGGGLTLITEIGYMELGNKVGIFFAPGEVAPEVFWGGATPAEKSWSGTSWNYTPIAETAGIDTFMVFGICNDQIGYVVTDNDVRSILTENEEVMMTSFHAGSALVKCAEALFAAVK